MLHLATRIVSTTLTVFPAMQPSWRTNPFPVTCPFSRALRTIGPLMIQNDKLSVLAELEGRIRSDPLNPSLHFEMVGEHMKLNQLSEAASSLRRCLQLGVDEHLALDVYHSIADALVDNSQYAEAAACWRHSLEIEPRNLGVMERLAYTLRLAGELQQAASLLYLLANELEGQPEDQSWIYVDLGSVIEQIVPTAGSGPEWVDTRSNEPNLAASRQIKLSSPDGDEHAICALTCYSNAIRLNPQNGEAHKRLADLLVQLQGPQAAQASFARAAELMPDDICCATHIHFGAPVQRHLPPIPIRPKRDVLLPRGRAGLSALVVQPGGAGWAPLAASTFEELGAVVMPAVLREAELCVLHSAVIRGCESDSVTDLTPETRNAKHRTHKALRLDSDTLDTLSNVLARLHPLLSLILQAPAFPLIGCGFMRVFPGAEGQELHKDVHGHDRHAPVGELRAGGSARAVSIQLQLTDTTIETPMGSLALLPATHRPDGAQGDPSTIETAVRDPSAFVVPVTVPAGSITLYSSRLWHCGSKNMSDQERIFCFVTVIEPGSPAPPGLIHTACREDVGCWSVDSSGLRRL